MKKKAMTAADNPDITPPKTRRKKPVDQKRPPYLGGGFKKIAEDLQLEPTHGFHLITNLLKGGPGSGNHGHSGRPGQVGGSGGGGGSKKEPKKPESSKTPSSGSNRDEKGRFRAINQMKDNIGESRNALKSGDLHSARMAAHQAEKKLDSVVGGVKFSGNEKRLQRSIRNNLHPPYSQSSKKQLLQGLKSLDELGGIVLERLKEIAG